MYSIPVHALRFAAHCRSRLRLDEAVVADCSRGSAIAGVSRYWLRFTPHAPRFGLARGCVPLRGSSVRP